MMEHKKNSQRNPPLSATSHFTESNAGHISVQTTSPFLNKIKDSEFKVSENQCKTKKNLSTVLMNKILRKDASAGTSKLLINQILGDNLDNETIIKLNQSYTEKSLNVDKQCNYNQHFIVSNVQYQYSTPTFNCKSFSTHHGSLPRQDQVVLNRITENHRDVPLGNNNAELNKHLQNKKTFAEKTTYCRPSVTYNQELIDKTVERNNKLQRLVKKLILIRTKEKQTEAWNNYINELKSKYKHYDTEPNRIIRRHPYEEPSPLEYIDDYYENQSNPCKDLLQDFYDAYETIQFNSTYETESQNTQVNKPSSQQKCRSYFKHSNCYPISSQGRLMMLNRERGKNPFVSDWQHRPVGRPMYGNTIIVDREPTRLRSSYIKNPTKKSFVVNNKFNCGARDCAVQTEYNILAAQYGAARKLDVKQEETNTEEQIGITKMLEFQQNQSNAEEPETVKDAYTRVSENVERLKQRIHETCSVDRKTVLESIENKLDSLITSINSFIDEVKSRTYVRQCFDCHSVSVDRTTPCNRKTNVTRSETIGLNTAEKLVCGVITENSPLTSRFDRRLTEKSSRTNINRIFMEEMESSSRTKEDIENILSGSVGIPCSVQISIDIPTRERSTEVTESLERTGPKFEPVESTSVSIQEIDRSVGEGDAPNMTIAVNTDPLGVLALLRISKETVKQLLSYVPNIPYHSLILSLMTVFPQTREVPHYVCNICGAAFGRPSQLSDHIQRHDLTKTRDCCVCRHVLDMQRHRYPGLFRCQYCGQRFTRAYCCELHQESCAKRLGRRHDVSPSLVLLR